MNTAQQTQEPSFIFTDAQRDYMRNENRAEMEGLIEVIAHKVIEHRRDNNLFLTVLEILDNELERVKSCTE